MSMQTQASALSRASHTHSSTAHQTKHTPNETSPNTSQQKLSVTAYLTMALLAIQFGLQPIFVKNLVMKTSNPSPDVPPVSGPPKVALVLVTEFVKVLLTLSALVIQRARDSFTSSPEPRIINSKLAQQRLQQQTVDYSLYDFFSWHTVVIFLTAIIYAVQNILTYIAYSNLPSVVYNIINQTKMLFSALLLYIFLNKKQSTQQIIALGVVFSCTVITVIAASSPTFSFSSLFKFKNYQSSSHPSLSADHFLYGIIPAFLSAMTSGFATVLLQYALRSRSSYQITLQLTLASILVLILAHPLFLTSDHERALVKNRQWSYGWSWSATLPILSNAIGGILVGKVTELAGGVSKGMALSAGIAIGLIVEKYAVANSNLLLSHQAQNIILFAFLALVLAIYIYGSYPYISKSNKRKFL